MKIILSLYSVRGKDYEVCQQSVKIWCIYRQWSLIKWWRKKDVNGQDIKKILLQDKFQLYHWGSK